MGRNFVLIQFKAVLAEDAPLAEAVLGKNHVHIFNVFFR